jgi:hypothetical protein
VAIHEHRGRLFLTTKPVFLPKSCEHCSGHAAYDIMTRDRKGHWVCVLRFNELKTEVIAGYKIRVLNLEAV